MTARATLQSRVPSPSSGHGRASACGRAAPTYPSAGRAARTFRRSLRRRRSRSALLLPPRSARTCHERMNSGGLLRTGDARVRETGVHAPPAARTSAHATCRRARLRCLSVRFSAVWLNCVLCVHYVLLAKTSAAARVPNAPGFAKPSPVRTRVRVSP